MKNSIHTFYTFLRFVGNFKEKTNEKLLVLEIFQIKTCIFLYFTII